MKKFIPPLWVITTGLCVYFILSAYVDTKKGKWGDFVIDLLFVLWFFILAHHAWEQGKDES